MPFDKIIEFEIELCTEYLIPRVNFPKEFKFVGLSPETFNLSPFNRILRN